ncbi:chaperone modulator CbpM [Flavobacterium sp. 102]|uniref:chaperone modulator CbpM n=1 Tax=Flavobacterium sp. 102 TaxID=2135623 RepID=UPI000EB4B9EB|nr:chaperone modulator CbpM [Flavobacterium sp. 102]RKS03575.1 MerR-like DNA binding protein [Flavobacterium sp. 102]
MTKEDLILIDHFCQHHGIEPAFIVALKEFDLIEILVLEEKQYIEAAQLAKIEKIIRLHHELEINLEGIDIIMNLLEQLDHYKSQLTSARNKLDFFEKQ